MAKFKFGDKVKTLVGENYFGQERFPVGTIGIIVYDADSEGDYAVHTSDDYWYYKEDELELVAEPLSATEAIEWLVNHYWDDYEEAFGYDYAFEDLLDKMTPEAVVQKIADWKAAHEVNEDECVWKHAICNDWYVSCNNNGKVRYMLGVTQFKHCPFCGKKIKVV